MSDVMTVRLCLSGVGVKGVGVDSVDRLEVKSARGVVGLAQMLIRAGPNRPRITRLRCVVSVGVMLLGIGGRSSRRCPVPASPPPGCVHRRGGWVEGTTRLVPDAKSWFCSTR